MKRTVPLPPSFADFFSDTFACRFPHVAEVVRPDVAAFAANVYLFRFDKKLSQTFVSAKIDAVARTIADATGKSLPEARRIFSTGARDAAREYFADTWHDVSRYVRANATSLSNLHLESVRHTAEVDAVTDVHGPVDVDLIRLQSLLDRPRPVIVFIYANFCSVCKALRPKFDQASRDLGDESVLFVTLNGPKYSELKDLYNVTSYPTIIRFLNGAESVTVFPILAGFSTDRCVAFARGEYPDDQAAQPPTVAPESPLPLDDTASPRTRTSHWQSLLKRRGIDELDELASERTEVLSSQIDLAIQCGESSCSLPPPRTTDPENEDATPPLCALLGGGMGAGKTTVVGLISATPFWQLHGSSVVVVEADAFKLSDPLFQVLQSVTPLASRIVHSDSIAAAEELFLKAVNARRDVVFDGTLSWYEYARQTVAMLRDRHYYYERGPGYVEASDGTVSEIYWVRAERRERAVEPYHVELVGVTAETEVAVMRGIVRKISTGRGVAIPDQLKSHALFSQHFEQYLDLVDSVYLFDTTIPKGNEDKSDYATQLVAIRPGLLFDSPPEDDAVEVPDKRTIAIDGFDIRNADSYERFLRKSMLNTRATSVSELFLPDRSKR